MNPNLHALFDEPEKRYLQPEELSLLSQYVTSLPERVAVYRRLRDEEVTLMQQVVNALEQQFPRESEDRLKRSLQNGLLALRYAAMAMLTDDPDFVSKRLQSWLPDMVAAYGTQAIDVALHGLLQQQLGKRFTPQQVALLAPGLAVAREMVEPGSKAAIADEADVAEATLLDIF